MLQPKKRIAKKSLKSFVPPVKRNIEEKAAYQDDDFVVFASGEYSEQMTHNKYVVKNLVVAEGHNLLFAPTGHLKTFVGAQIAVCVANGLPFNGLPVDQGEVVYVIGEGARVVDERIKTAEKHYGVKKTIWVLPNAVHIPTEKSMDRLRRFIESRKGAVKLVIFDTAARCSFGVDEDSNTEVNAKVNAPLTNLMEKTGVAVLVLHHAGYNETHPRGATAWSDPCDSVIRVDTYFENKYERRGPKIVNIRGIKLRDDEPVTVHAKPIKKNDTLVLVNATKAEAKAAAPSKGRPRKDEAVEVDEDGVIIEKETTPKRGLEKKREGRGRLTAKDKIIVALMGSELDVQGTVRETGLPEKTVKNTYTDMVKDQTVVRNNGFYSLAHQSYN